MSRRSTAFADGQWAFSWNIEEVKERDANGDGRYKASCRNLPDVFAFGDTEQLALQRAQKVLEVRVETVGADMKTPGSPA